jgi:hypothetical protein
MTIATYPTARALPGTLFRHLVMPDDLAAMNEVANAARQADGDEWVTPLDQFRAFYENLSNCDPATDIVVAERAGRIVGYGRVAWFEDLEGVRIYEPISLVDPTDDGSLLESIHTAMEARGSEIAATHPPGPKVFQSEAGEHAVRRIELLERTGYKPVRYGFVMVRAHLDDLDAPLPDGLEIRDVRPEHLRAIFDAEVEAFRDHWGMGLPTEADYRQFLSDPVQGDHTLWRVAWDGDQVAGMVRSYINPEENERYGRKRWLGREHQRPAALAAPRARARAHRGVVPVAARARHDRGRAGRGHGEPLGGPARVRGMRLRRRAQGSGVPQAARVRRQL